MYNKIINPITRRKVNINGKLGRKILSKYIHLLFGGGGPESSPVRTDSDIPEPDSDSQDSTESTPPVMTFKSEDKKEEIVKSKNSNMAMEKTTEFKPTQPKPKNSNSGK